MKKNNYKGLIRFVCFSAVLIMLLNALSVYFVPLSNKDLWINNGGGVFGEPENSLDYVVIGSSNAVAGVSPLEIYHQYGYAGYTFGESFQTVNMSYFMLKKIEKKQKPKLVIIETDCFYDWKEKNKTNCELYDKDLQKDLEYIFPVVRYHSCWRDFSSTRKIKKMDMSWQSTTRGQNAMTEVKPYNGKLDEYMFTERKNHGDNIRRRMKIYIDAIIIYCKRNDINLMFLSIPCATSWNHVRHDNVQKIADKYDIPYLDLNLHLMDMDFDWTKDTRDNGTHTNISGANKVSNYLGEYIKNNYSIGDKRAYAEYARWNDDYKKYAAISLEETK